MAGSTQASSTSYRYQRNDMKQPKTGSRNGSDGTAAEGGKSIVGTGRLDTKGWIEGTANARLQSGLASPYPSFHGLPQQRPGQPTNYGAMHYGHNGRSRLADDGSVISADGERTPLISNTRPSEHDSKFLLHGSRRHDSYPQHHHMSNADAPPKEHYIPINGLPPNRLQNRSSMSSSLPSSLANRYSQSTSQSSSSGSGSGSSDQISPSLSTCTSSSASSPSMMQQLSSALPSPSYPPRGTLDGSDVVLEAARLGRSSSPSDSSTARTTRSAEHSANMAGRRSSPWWSATNSNNGGGSSTHDPADHTDKIINVYSDDKSQTQQQVHHHATLSYRLRRCLCYLPFCCRKRNSEHDHSNSHRGTGNNSRCFSDVTKCIVAISLSCIALLLCSKALFSHGLFDSPQGAVDANADESPSFPLFSNSIEKMKWEDQWLLDERGRYRIVDYDQQPPFFHEMASTIAAGVYGKPLYGGFVNRGQAMMGFGLNCSIAAGKDDAAPKRCSPIMRPKRSVDDAFSTIPFQGFRTFLQVQPPTPSDDARQQKAKPSHVATKVVEPFSALGPSMADATKKPKRTMYIGEGVTSLQLQEVDEHNHLETNITYFTLPEEDFGAMVRRVQITNLKHDAAIAFGILDGLVQMEPSRNTDDQDSGDDAEKDHDGESVYEPYHTKRQPDLKVTFPYSNTYIMAYYQSARQRPFQKSKQDVAQFGGGSGHYCFAMMQYRDTEPSTGGGSPTTTTTKAAMLPIVYNTETIFGQDTAFSQPQGLNHQSISDMIQTQPHGEQGRMKTASAFAASDMVELEPGQSVIITSIYGRADSIMDVPVFARRVMQEGFVDFKYSRIQDLWRQLTRSTETTSSSTMWNKFVARMYLHNSLIGGYPLILGDSAITDDGTRAVDEDPRLKVYHTFSTSNEGGYDMPSMFFSQTNANFAAAMDNRRNDVVFNPRISSSNLRTLLTFMRSDGSFPSTLGSMVFNVKTPQLCAELAQRAVGQAEGHRAQREALSGKLEQGPYIPGELFAFLEEHHIGLMISRQEFIDIVLAASDMILVANDGDASSHKNGQGPRSERAWMTVLEMLKSFLFIFPDNEEWLLFEEQLPYFAATGNAPSYDYDGGTSGGISVQDVRSNLQHDQFGKIFRSTAFEKLLLLATSKFASRDPLGIGIIDESASVMPYSAHNSRVWSDVTFTSQLKSLLQYLRDALSTYETTITISNELSKLLDDINDALDEKRKALNEPVLKEAGTGDTGKATKESFQSLFSASAPQLIPQPYVASWNRIMDALSTYTRSTKDTFGGWAIPVPAHVIVDALDVWLEEIEFDSAFSAGLGTSTDQLDEAESYSHPLPTYFKYEITAWAAPDDGMEGENTHSAFVGAPAEIKVIPQPLFLDGAVYAMNAATPDEAQKIYSDLRNSALFDDTLVTYRRCHGTGMGDDRCWLPDVASSYDSHYSIPDEAVSSTAINFKLYLELLRNGMHEHFFEALLSGGMPPFIDPELYGRAVLDPTSHVVMSDVGFSSLIGRGLSTPMHDKAVGSSDFLSLWVRMMVGPTMFFIQNNENDEGKHLEMQLRPTIPLWMFTRIGGDSDGDDDDSARPTSQALRATVQFSPSPLQATVGSGKAVHHIGFMLFSSIQVDYFNERGTDLKEAVPSRYRVILRDGTVFDVPTSTIRGELAAKIRRVTFIESIEAYYE